MKEREQDPALSASRVEKARSSTGWRKAVLLAVAAVYGPFLLIGVFGFRGDHECRLRWWQHLPVLPGLAPAEILLRFPDQRWGSWRGESMMPSMVRNAWSRGARMIRESRLRLAAPAGVTLGFVVLLTVSFREVAERRRIRVLLFTGGCFAAGLVAWAAYAMFLA